jgi:Flp pilus assembly protein TadB
MSKEQERLKHLRERQLSDRDPLVKQRQFQRTTAQKERKVARKRLTLGEIWGTLPNIYKSPFYGLLLGLLAMIILPILWVSPWAFWVALGATGFFVLLGALIGRAQDIRDELRDISKH